MSSDKIILHALELFQADNFDQATETCLRWLDLYPNGSQGLHLLGLIKAKQGYLDQAIVLLNQSIALEPENTAFHVNLANIYRQSGQIDAAFKHYHHAASLDPLNAEALQNLAVLLYDKDSMEQAQQLCQLALRIDPQLALAHNTMGTIYKTMGNQEMAIYHYQESLRIDAHQAQAHYNLGTLLQENEDWDAAANAYKDAIKYHPEFAEAYSNLGVIYINKRCSNEASFCFQRALILKPSLVEAHYNYAFVLLSQGELVRGFEELEWRLHLKWLIPYLQHFRQPRWDGSSSIAGKSLLVFAEQGFGDTLQFSRYIPRLKEFGARIIFQCPAQLLQLLQRQFNIETVPFEQPTLTDMWMPLMSLPHLFKTTLETIPDRTPYLAPTKKKSLPVSTPDLLKVGIVWASGIRNDPSLASVYRRKSCPLELMIRYLTLNGVALYSLQVEKDTEELASLNSANVYDLSPLIQDFADTAALISELDLIISVDTAVAHLAGAMGKPLWILLPYVADWRWLTEGRNCHWYPTATLFRQPTPEDWNGVLSEIRQVLLKRIYSTYCSIRETSC